MANGLRSRTSPVGCGAGAGVDSAWEQEKLEATLREMLEKAARPSGSPQRPVHVANAVPTGGSPRRGLCLAFGCKHSC